MILPSPSVFDPTEDPLSAVLTVPTVALLDIQKRVAFSILAHDQTEGLRHRRRRLLDTHLPDATDFDLQTYYRTLCDPGYMGALCGAQIRTLPDRSLSALFPSCFLPSCAR